jgi:hypothetical protein
MTIHTKDIEALNMVKLVFPDFNKREVSIEEFHGPMRLDSYWDSGSREYWAIINLANKKHKVVPENGTPFSNGGKIYRMAVLPKNLAVIKWKKGGYEYAAIYLNKENMNQLIPQTTEEIPWAERVVLSATRGLKSSYGGVSNYRFVKAREETGITQQEWEAAKASLIGKRFLNAAGAITTDGRNAIGNVNLYNLKRPV